jgi:hypothetical protein
MRCSFVPPYLLARLSESVHGVLPDPAAECGRSTLARDTAFREAREQAPAAPPAHPSVVESVDAAWAVHTADNREVLPGRRVRSAGEPPSGDAAVDEAAHGIEASLALAADAFGRRSYDGRGAPVSATVHYGDRYDNAFWDGRQLVFGDGDGVVFERFTKPVDVLGHEFAHGLVEHTAGLRYRDQPGALNESVSDVFAACLKQRLRGETVDRADWLIGEGLFRHGVHARGLRDMRNPGTAYDDARLGTDPQGGHMDDYVETRDDNGGVHLNSGIPNRAFVLAATALGGHAWEGAGRIWYAALTGDDVGPDTDFAGFAAATIAAAGEHAVEVRRAWEQVGVPVPGGTATTAAGPGSASPEHGPVADDVVEVRRSGGILGRTETGRVDLRRDDPRAGEVRALVARLDLTSAREVAPQPDRYVYTFCVGGCEVQVPEQELSGDLRRLASLVLPD